jgi:hypothetical protein
MFIESANMVALDPLRNRISITSICEDKREIFIWQNSNQKIFVSCGRLMSRLSSMYVPTLFIIKLELSSRVRSMECIKITFFNFLDNHSTYLIFGSKLRRYV